MNSVGKFLTVDLDSTLADTRHRHHMIDRVNGTDWEAYSKACVDDDVIEPTRVIVETYYAFGVEVHYVTGRVEESRHETLQWLRKKALPVDGLWMDEQPNRFDSKSHALYKRDRVLEVIAHHPHLEHLLHVDDWPDVKVRLEEQGVPCLCVRAPHEIDAFMAEQGEGPR